MQYNPFGRTGLTVSALGLGCSRLGGNLQGGNVQQAIATLQKALESGINFYDTADSYGQGQSERLLGKTFRNRRDQVILATKAGYCLSPVGTLAARVKPILKPIVRMVKPQTSSLYRAKGTLLRQNFSREYVIQCVEGSLRRLQTDYIDLFQLHSPPKEVVKSDEVFESLITLRRHGKIRHFGVSCETIEDAMLCLRVPGLSALQVEINLLDQSAIPALLPAAKQAGVAIIARQPFASGRLFHDPERAVEQIRIARYRQLAEQHDLSLAHLALQFVNQLEGVSVVIAGVNTPIHLADSLSALSASPLTTDQMSILCEILTAVP